MQSRVVELTRCEGAEEVLGDKREEYFATGPRGDFQMTCSWMSWNIWNWIEAVEAIQPATAPTAREFARRKKEKALQAKAALENASAVK